MGGGSSAAAAKSEQLRQWRGTISLHKLELSADEGHKGEAWRHHSLRVSYIAQHSLHHLEEYLNETPIHYIQERFRLGMDRELSKLKTAVLTEEEQEIMKDLGSVNEVSGRQMRGKQMWYEVVKTGRKSGDTQWVPLEELKNPKAWKPYVLKLIKNFDERQMALDSGMAIRPITSTEILAHLEAVAAPELGRKSADRKATLTKAAPEHARRGTRARRVLAALADRISTGSV